MLTSVRHVAVLALLLLLAPFSAAAQSACEGEDYCTVATDETRAITAHGICRKVTNGNAAAIMVPTRSPDEWATGRTHSFLSNVPPGVIVALCEARETVPSVDCSEISGGRTVQSYFDPAVWTNPEEPKTVIIPAGCNMCRTSGFGSSTLSIGATPWAGDLTVLVNGSLTGGSVGSDRSDADRIVAFDANILGAQGQKVTLVVDGGRVVSGGRDGAYGYTGPGSLASGVSCIGGGNFRPSCFSVTEIVPDANGGAGGRGENCGVPAQAGRPGQAAISILYPYDRWSSMSYPVYTYDFFCKCMVRTDEVYYYVINDYRMATGARGGDGEDGRPAVDGVRNPQNADILVLNGGEVRGI